MAVENIGPRGLHDSRVPDDWFVGFQHGLAARFWRAAAATMADDDARLVHELLGAPRGARVLDVPCGDGRLTVRLAAVGYVATGVDLAEAELDRSRLAAVEAGVEARFVTGDLRELPDVGPVDGIVSWGNSFGYLIPAETARSLACMHRLLSSNGRLVLESLTVAESPGRRRSEGAGRVGVRRRSHDRPQSLQGVREPAGERLRLRG